MESRFFFLKFLQILSFDQGITSFFSMSFTEFFKILCCVFFNNSILIKFNFFLSFYLLIIN